MSVLALLPCKNEKRDSLEKRRNRMIYCVANRIPYDGILLHLDEKTQAVLLSLNTAIACHEESPKYVKSQRNLQRPGKTERDRQGENYVSADERRRARSEASRNLRSQMRGGGGRK